SNGELSNAIQFTYRSDVSTPQITSFTPDHDFTSGGALVTINGTDFVPADIAVRFGDRTAKVQSGATTTKVIVKAPENLEGPVSILVANADGGEATNGPFTYMAQTPLTPVITELLPSQGFRESTTVITVHGQPRSFAPGTTATVGGLPAVTSYF